MDDDNDNNGFPWHLGVFDAHCHPTDTLSSLQSVPSMRAKVLTIMATRAQDQELVAKAADEYGVSEADSTNLEVDSRQEYKVVPSFGWHPWFSHQMFDESDYNGATSLTVEQKTAHYKSVLSPAPEDPTFLQSLPEPRPFGEFIDRTRHYLEKYPLALVGEVGLDRSFRIPEAWLPQQVDQRDDGLTPGGREGRRLSPYRVSLDHQRKVLGAQLRLAGEQHRAVSVHGVAAHGMVYETIAKTWEGHEREVLSNKERKKQAAARKVHAESVDESSDPTLSGPKPYPPRVCLHSYSGPPEAVKQYIAPSVPCEVFFSFSTTINSWNESGEGKVEAALNAVPEDRVVIESDMHIAGADMDHQLQSTARKVCSIKGWELEAGVRQLGSNWKRFVFGGG